MDRSKTRVFPLIELNKVRDLNTGEVICISEVIQASKRPLQLKASSRVTQPVGTTPITLTTEVVSVANGITNTNGVTTALYSGLYSVDYQVNLVRVSGTGYLELWSELSLDGNTWSYVTDSAQIQRFSANGDGGVNFNINLTPIEGVMFRTRARVTSGSAEIKSEALENGFIVPSIRYEVVSDYIDT